MSIKKRICTLFITLALMLSMTSLPNIIAKINVIQLAALKK